jgi:hypothetical protein
MYHPGTRYQIVSSEYWWSDAWSAEDYGKEWNPEESFFAQMNTLMEKVPRSGNKLSLCENCDYCDNIRASKNCYYAFNGWAGPSYFENGYYTVASGAGSRNIVDTLWAIGCEDAYDIIHGSNVRNSQSCYHCQDIDNCQYVRYSQGCSFCFLCEGIQNKKYSFMNTSYSEDEYSKKVAAFLALPKKDQAKKVQDFFMSIPKKSLNNVGVESVLGNAISESKNAYYAFSASDTEDIKYCFTAFGVKDSMDCTNYGVDGTLCYETHNVWHTHKVVLSMNCIEQCREVFYSDNCSNCQNCFGCVGLKNKQYCIFNTQHTKEEYEKRVPEIIEKMIQDGEWGEFFPSSLSPFGYNETVAMDCHPLTQEEAQKLSYSWSNYESPLPKVEKIIPASRLPEDIHSVPDDVLNWAIECELTGRPFRIIKQELEFYRKHSIPLPRRHPDQRSSDRISQESAKKLFERTCGKCHTKMITTYAPERPEIVYCEKCYEREVIN